MKMVSRQICKLHKEKKVPYHEILILYRVKRTHKLSIIDTIQYALQNENIPYFWLTENDEAKRSFEKEDGKVKISTIDSSKGLDYQAVFIVNVDSMPFPLEENPEREASLMYIAMTRAKQYLCISYSGHSEFTEYFDEWLLEKEQEKSTLSIVKKGS